jgi:hypothetical protein
MGVGWRVKACALLPHLLYILKPSSPDFEEEAGAETALLGENTGNSTGDGGLSGASHVLKSKYGLGLRIVGPFGYIPKQAD